AAVVFGGFRPRRYYRNAVVVGGGARRLAVVAPSRVALAEGVDDAVLPGVVHVLQAARARVGGVGELRQHALHIRQRQGGTRPRGPRAGTRTPAADPAGGDLYHWGPAQASCRRRP